MKILISGHKGFVGSYLTKRLDKEKIDWVGFDLKDGQDIKNAYQVYEVFDMHRPDTVIHLAALAGVRRGEEYPQDYFDTNVLGTWNLVRIAEKFSVNKFINFASSSIYGDQLPPIKEVYSYKPKSIYGKTKTLAISILKNSNIINKVSIVPFTIYGLNGRKDMVIYKWLDQIKRGDPISFYGNGKSKRGYVHIEDLIDGVMLCLKTKVILNTTVNLGGNEIISLNDLADIFLHHFRKLKFSKLEMPSSDIYENWADISWAKILLNWQPKRKFKEEIKKIIKNYEI